jgi:hypothetical protein
MNINAKSVATVLKPWCFQQTSQLRNALIAGAGKSKNSCQPDAFAPKAYPPVRVVLSHPHAGRQVAEAFNRYSRLEYAKEHLKPGKEGFLFQQPSFLCS